VLGFNILRDFHPLGGSSNVLDLEDFLVSYNLLPLGAIVYLLFCVSKHGWGWDRFVEEADAGKGMRFPRLLCIFMAYVAPLLIVLIYLKGYYDTFSSMEGAAFIAWMCLAVLFLGFVGYIVFSRRRKVDGR
jgi:NSS family neurotransmitter:Na+ symporter